MQFYKVRAFSGRFCVEINLWKCKAGHCDGGVFSVLTTKSAISNLGPRANQTVEMVCISPPFFLKGLIFASNESLSDVVQS